MVNISSTSSTSAYEAYIEASGPQKKKPVQKKTVSAQTKSAVKTSHKQTPASNQPKTSQGKTPDGTYKVSSGDTLYSIATRYGTSVSDIVKANPDLKKDSNGNWVINIDFILELPQNAKVQPTKTVQENKNDKWGKWQIEQGKGAYSVMTKFNLYREELQKLNPEIDLNKIKAEDVFNVPGYTVKAGDTFASIAEAHDITEQMLRELNPKMQTLKANVTVNVPKKAGEELGFDDLEIEVDTMETSEVQSHILKEGETLSAVALKYKVPVWALMISNNIDDARNIPKNTVIEIPTAEDVALLENAKKDKAHSNKNDLQKNENDTTRQIKPKISNEQPQAHKVANGDSLSVIAQKYKVPQWALIAKNNISNPSKLSVNQVLQIPTAEEINELKHANTANKTSARVKQTTKKQKVQKQSAVNKQGAISPNAGLVNHKVKPNDTLASLAKEYGVNVKDLIAYNKLKGVSSTTPLTSKKITSIKVVGNQSAVKAVTGVSQKFIDDLISVEKKRSSLYDDGCGFKTIGIGHNTKAHKDEAKYKGRKLTDTEIYSLLARDILEAQDTMKRHLGESYNKLSQHQKEALYGLIFNTGGLNQSPKLVEAIKKKDWAEAACQMDHASGTVNGKKQVLPGLAKRRFMDISTFVSGSNLNASQMKKVMAKTQDMYTSGYSSIKNSNNKVDYNAYAKKYLGRFIDKGYIKIKEQS